MSVLREVLRDAIHVLIFMDFGGAVVIFILGIKTQFSRMDEYLDRRGNFFSLSEGRCQVSSQTNTTLHTVDRYG
jgi:hypothetical protein